MRLLGHTPRRAGRTPGLFLRWYEALLRAYGPQGWWPGRSRFEVIAGAILTQGVAWSNVERAIRNLRSAGLLRPGAMRRASLAQVARLIRPAGYYNQKARRLRAFLRLLHEVHDGRLDRLFRRSIAELREELLALPGIGRETADAVILYAARKPIFVIDAYTRRVLRRHGEARGDEPYDDLRIRMEGALPARAALFNEYHALLVRVGKERCLKGRPLCAGCPLEPYLPSGGPLPEPPPAGALVRRKLTQDIVSTRVTGR
jgi:endonuclease-3 related protein